MKKIFLAGDSIEDLLILTEKYINPKGNPEPLINWQKNNRVIFNKLPGGSHLIAYFLDHFKNEYQLIVDTNINMGMTSSGDRIQTISKVDQGKLTESNYHIKEFFGYSVVKPSEYKINEAQNLKDFDAMIIDDLSNDLRHTPDHLLKDLKTFNPKGHIIYKLNGPATGNKFFEHIATEYGHNLISIINADDLRDHGISIRKKLSWDSTLADFLEAQLTNPYFEHLNKSKAILIRFGLEAVLAIYNEKETSDRIDYKQNSIYRLYYLPQKCEAEIKDSAEGTMQGLTSAFVVAFTRNFLNPYSTLNLPDQNSIKEQLKASQTLVDVISNSILSGMQAALNCMSLGYTLTKENNLDYPVQQIFNEKKGIENIHIIDISNYRSSKSLVSTILSDSKVLIENVAFNYVVSGSSGFLDMVPVGVFSELKTFDREEIENFRAFRKMVMEYLSRPNEKKPLSYAVFGPPGSGKSFGIKKIIKSLGQQMTILEKNLSQFDSYEDLVKVFQESRDISLKGNIPIVFFDEFDSSLNGQELGWLKYFLAPMQDGEFKEGEVNHPVGKGIYIFAGGTRKSFEEFCAPLKSSEDESNYAAIQKTYKSAKAKDFISRLKGYINIKGIDCRDAEDHLYPLRRAMVLRSKLLEIPGIADRNKLISIGNEVLGALLKIPTFEHGSRSLEAIIAMSDLQNAKGFQKSNLPSDKLLNMHLDNTLFQQLMNEQYLPSEAIEIIAIEMHNSWLENEKAKGENKPTMKSWDQLDESSKDSNRQQAMDILRKLDKFDYKIISGNKKDGIREFDSNDLEEMAKIEHDRWMTEKISKGWTYGEPRVDELKIHNSLIPWNKLPEDVKELDRNAIRLIPNLLERVGFVVLRDN